MRITCPQCQAGYDVDPEKIPAGGLRVRCPQCDRVFSVKVAQSTSTTMSGQPAAEGPLPTMVGAPRPPVPAGMTMVGMAPPPPPAAPVHPDAPVPLPGNAPPPAPEPQPAPEPHPEVFANPTGAIPLPAPSGGEAVRPGRRRRTQTSSPVR